MSSILLNGESLELDTVLIAMIPHSHYARGTHNGNDLISHANDEFSAPLLEKMESIW